jgi:hypothetical protein
MIRSRGLGGCRLFGTIKPSHLWKTERLPESKSNVLLVTATPFALVSAEDDNKVFAYGLDIEMPSGREVITFRRDSSGHSMFGVHQSVEAARQRFSTITPLELVWEQSCRCGLIPVAGTVHGEECPDDGGAENAESLGRRAR